LTVSQYRRAGTKVDSNDPHL